MIHRTRAERLDAETLQLKWDSDAPGTTVAVYRGPTPTQADMTAPVVRTTDRQVAVRAPVAVPGRPCFTLIPETGRPVVVAERRVPLQGCFNFRDLGGYGTDSGRRLKWGKVFRSDAMARLTDHDRLTLKSLGLRLVIDFRAPSETQRSPDRLPADGSVDRVHLPVVHGDLDSTVALERAAAGDLAWLTPDFMTRGYLNNIESFPHVWGAVFQRLADGASLPVAFHCSAGKDRAGTCAALVLLALGVPEETVVADHALSNVYIRDILPQLHQRLRGRGIDPEPLAAYFQAPETGIRALMDHIRTTYGSARDYLVGRCHVAATDLGLLENALLED
ncbi:MAG: tyrosine-protein phosphatase [Desulfobacterales bacterium]|nr:tyrosine-protein phosphatase [Desulfobacterales bacterium]